MTLKISAFSDEASASLSGQIAALRRNGIRMTELRSVDGKNVSELSRAEAKSIRKQLADEGISVWSLGSPLGKAKISEATPEYFDTVKKVCENAVLLGTDKARIFSFFDAYGEKNKVLDTLNAMAETAASYGVTFYHENEKHIYGDTAARVRELMDGVKGLGFIYDPANFLQAGEKADDTLSLVPKCDYFHIKDVVAATGELVPAGYGDGKIDKLLTLINRDSVLSIEPHLAVFEGYDRIDGSEMKHRFEFGSPDEAFDAAVKALRDLLAKSGNE